ncbi:MAG TPA: hypothetical protein ACFYD0_13500 [Candidatus Wunengus sp. YC65]|uniref:hypothetical protein n=1 Tax=Candidatus Wunengus sp. YC65 TaxID=3367701 RepID=UPI00402673A4
MSAEPLGQPGINSTTTDSSLVGTETTPPPDPSSPVIQQEGETSQAPQPVDQTVTTNQPGPQAAPCTTVKADGDTWLDRVHALVQDNTCEPTVWFDSFFGKDHILLDLRPGVFIILRNTARWTEGDTVAYVQDFHLALELPQWERLLRKSRLYIESRSDAEKYTAQPGEPVQPGVNRATGVRQPIIGLRVDPYTRPHVLIRIDSGIKINMHPDAFIRARYQYLKTFGEVYLIRFSEIALWQAVEHFSNTFQVDLERKITTFTLVRWGNNVTYIEDTPGVTWNTGISFFTQLTPKSAIFYDTSMWGVNDPEWIIQNYRVGSQYRRNFYRPWLFFELEPEVTWPKDESGHRKSTFAFMATLEIQFGK